MLQKSLNPLFSMLLLIIWGCSQQQDLQKYVQAKVAEIEEKYEAHKNMAAQEFREGKDNMENAKLCLEKNLWLAALHFSEVGEKYIDYAVRTEMAKANKENIEFFQDYWNEQKSKFENMLSRYQKSRNRQGNGFLRAMADLKAFAAKRYFESGKHWLEIPNPIYALIYTSRGVLQAKRAADYSNISSDKRTELQFNVDRLKEELRTFGEIMVDDYSGLIQTNRAAEDYISPSSQISLGEKLIENNFSFAALIELLLAAKSYYLAQMKADKTVPGMAEYQEVKRKIDEEFTTMKDKDLSIGEFFRQMGEFYFLKYEKNKKEKDYFLNSFVIYNKVLPLFFKIIAANKIVITFVRWPFQ
ncbi:MAG: hypothetical protein ACE5I5_18250 [Candidatus Heimdallarchaeota archaeon]